MNARRRRRRRLLFLRRRVSFCLCENFEKCVCVCVCVSSTLTFGVYAYIVVGLDRIMFGIISQCFVDFKHLTKDKIFPFWFQSFRFALFSFVLVALGIRCIRCIKLHNKRKTSACFEFVATPEVEQYRFVCVSAQIVVMRKKNENNK